MDRDDARARGKPSPDAGTEPLGSIDQRQLFRLFFFGAFAYLIYQLFRILSPFLTAITGALIIALVFFPAHARLSRYVPHRNAAAALTTTLALVVVVVPFLLLGWLLVGEAAAVVPHVRSLLTAPLASGGGPALHLPESIDRLWMPIRQFLDRSGVELRSVAIDSVRELGNAITASGAAMLKNSLFMVFKTVVLVVATFFFFRDGPDIVRAVVKLVPMEEEHKGMVIGRLADTLSAIVRSAFITASVQGLLAGLGFAVAGVHFPVLLGFATALVAVVPFVGAAAIWLPTGLYLLYAGATVPGIGVLLWGALAVSLSDNLLRTYLIGDRAKLSLLLLFPGILGGIQVYGAAGALIGPLVIAAVLAFARIYHEQYAGRPPASGGG